MSGTKHDLIRFADALKEEVSASPPIIDASNPIDISSPRLLSDDFTEITIQVVDEEKMDKLQRTGARKHTLATAIWLVIAVTVITIYFLNRNPLRKSRTSRYSATPRLGPFRILSRQLGVADQ
jgi:hypothetical protein